MALQAWLVQVEEVTGLKLRETLGSRKRVAAEALPKVPSETGGEGS